MTAPIVRRLPLPADLRSPAAARAAVRSVAIEASLVGVLDEALLLTTELVTNAVLHARTDLLVEISADATNLTVAVLDGAAGPLIGTDALPNDERGRGLVLVDQLASRWGTMHHPAGKGVWFQLNQPSTIISTDAAELWPSIDPVRALGPLPDGGSVVEQLEKLLRRLANAAGIGAATVVVDENDGLGPRSIAGYGVAAGNGDGGSRIPLRLTRPWRGEIIIDAPIRGPLVELAAERIALLVENHRLRRADRQRRNWLTFLAEASDLLAQSLDVQLTYALIPRLVVPRLGIWCAVHVFDDGGELRLAACTHSDEAMLSKLLDELESTHAQLTEAIRANGPVPLAAPIDGITVALIARGQRLGTLTVGHDSGVWQNPDEIAAIEDIARRAALAIDNNRIFGERRAVATALQRSLLPPALPLVHGLDLGAEYVPAGEGVDVGGDFYDVVELPDGRWLAVIGDVSGKGVQAATVTGLVRDVTRVLVRDGRPLPDTLYRLNETLVERGAGRFCTLALAALDRQPDGSIKVTLYLAGHDKPVLVRADGSTHLVGRCGTALGLLSTIRTPVEHALLQPGDMLIFCTDGVTERQDGGVFFGVERLCGEVSALAGFPAEVVAARLRAAAVGFSQKPPRDDIAVLTVRNDS